MQARPALVEVGPAKPTDKHRHPGPQTKQKPRYLSQTSLEDPTLRKTSSHDYS